MAEGRDAVRRRIVHVLRTAKITVIAEESNAAAVNDRIRALKPDVAVVGLQMRGLDGIELLRDIDRSSARTRTVLIAGEADPATIYTALGAGAAGYLVDDAPAATIRAAVESAARGEVTLAPGVQTQLVGELQARAQSSGLTARNLAILTGLAEPPGRTTEQVARELAVSAATIKADLHQTYRALGVNTQASAVAAALRRGLIA